MILVFSSDGVKGGGGVAVNSGGGNWRIRGG